MTDLYLEWNGDLIRTPSGSVQGAVHWDRIRERIIRRFLTNSAQTLPDGSATPADYVFDPAYGIGAGALIDQNPTSAWLADLNRRMRQAVLSDAAVDPGSVPETIIKRSGARYQIFVNVTLINGQPGQVSISIGPSGAVAPVQAATESTQGGLYFDQTQNSGLIGVI